MSSGIDPDTFPPTPRHPEPELIRTLPAPEEGEVPPFLSGIEKHRFTKQWQASEFKSLKCQPLANA